MEKKPILGYKNITLSADKKPTPGSYVQELIAEAYKRKRSGDEKSFQTIMKEIECLYKIVNSEVENFTKAGLNPKNIQLPDVEEKIDQLFVNYCTSKNR